MLLFTLITASTQPSLAASELLQSRPVLSVRPSSVIIKVGDSARINLTLINSSVDSLKICFSVEGFPTSGFITLIVPPCVNLQSSNTTVSVLTVEATPAAAPQSFNAFVVANGGNWTVKAPLSITVVPAMPAWIPWSIILVFILILIVPLMMRTKKPKHKRK